MLQDLALAVIGIVCFGLAVTIAWTLARTWMP